MSKLIFGDGKILITAGINEDKTGVLKLEKLWEPWTVESGTYDVPTTLYFKDVVSCETLIEALYVIRDAMLEEL